MLQRPGLHDVPASAVGTALVVSAAAPIGPWLPVVLAVGLLGVLARAVTRWHAPATAVALLAVIVAALAGYGLVLCLVTGLLAAAYLVLAAGRPRLPGSMWLAFGAVPAVAVTLAALAAPVGASVWWLIAAACAAPLALGLASGRRGRE